MHFARSPLCLLKFKDALRGLLHEPSPTVPTRLASGDDFTLRERELLRHVERYER